MQRVICSVEQEEQRITPELQQVTPASVAERDHRAEDPVQDLGELLGPDAPMRRESLGEAGEAGDVDEHQ